MTEREWQQMLCDVENDKPGNLNERDGVDCPICKNRGYLTVLDDEDDPDFPTLAQKRCECMRKREIVRNAKRSGMGPMLGSKFSDFKVNSQWQFDLKEMAAKYAENPEGWFAALGQVGSGKTLIASCIANQLLRSGRELIVKSWPELVRESEAEWFESKEILRKYQQIECLFLDDFLKTKPNDRARDVAFEVLDYRYRNKMLTLITSEKTPDEIINFDSALWSRFRQMCGSNIFAIGQDMTKDQRQQV